MPKTKRELTPIFSSPDSVSTQVDTAMVDGITKQFPVENKDFRLECSNVHVKKKDFSHLDEKEAILKSRSLTYPVKGDLKLYSKVSGRVVDEVKDFTLAQVFAITDKHTMLYKGNNYSAANLIQLLPGAYTRRTDTGELETHFNTATGRSFRISLDPESQQFFIQIESSKTPLYALISQVFGVDDLEVSRFVPKDVWLENAKVNRGNEAKHIAALYRRLVSTKLQNANDPVEVQIKKLKDSMFASRLSEKTTEITLGKPMSAVSPEAILRAMRNLVQVQTGERQEDNRDSLQFKRVRNLGDFIERRFDAEKAHETVTKIRNKIQFNLEKIDPNNPKIQKAIPASPYNKVFTDFILSSNLVSTPSETNPIESLESIGKVTVLGKGEGGISDLRGVPMDARNIDPSHLGIIDPSRTPESENAGVDQRFTRTAHRDKDGNLYARVTDTAGKEHYLSVQEMMSSVVGFPHQKEDAKMVQAQDHGTIREVPRSKVQYWIPNGSDLYTVTTNLVPFLNSNHPGRLTMAGKAIPQALSLENREIPLVQTVRDGKDPFVKMLGQVVSTVSPVDGTVKKVSEKEIHIESKAGDVHKVPFVKNLPFNMKGFVDDEPTKLKVGDKVEEGQALTDNNYTKDGILALGKNLNVAYLPWKGYNHEDGIVIRKGAADSLSSLHSYKYDYSIKPETVDKKAIFKKYFPDKLTPSQLAKLDDRGFIKPGVQLEHGDPLYAVMERREPSAVDKVLGRLHKMLVNPYKDVIETWDHDEPGEVVDVHTESKDIRILCRSKKPLEIGDKLTGLHGNKGVVSLIVDDNKMPYNKETGEPVDVLLNPASVTSRINLGQLMETAAAKIAKKTGTPYLVQNFGNDSNIAKIREELKQHNISDTDELVDPDTNKAVKALAGPQYFLKLYKTTDSNYSARNYGSYDAYLQPSKGGSEGSKSVGFMEFLGLLGSDARRNLREIGTIKSEENQNFWAKFETGQPLPKPQTTFATKKFFDYLRAAGVNVKVNEGQIIAQPLTNHDILEQSHGEIKNPRFFSAKKLDPEEGGLFDISVTGGPRGTKWSHYKLTEPVVNPLFEKPIKTILGLKSDEYDKITSGEYAIVKKSPGVYDVVKSADHSVIREIHLSLSQEKQMQKTASDKHQLVGGAAFRELLNDIDVTGHIEAAKKEFLTAKSVSKRDASAKKLKYLKGLQDQGISKIGDNIVLDHMPVLPPIMRPAINKGANRVEFADVNELYKDHMLVNQSLEGLPEHLPHHNLTIERKALYDGVKALFGIGDAINGATAGKNVKGIMTQIAGDGGPKGGIFHSKILSKKQDFSGRATIYAAPDVKFNEAKFPKEMLWSMYRSHLIRDLVQSGYSLPDAMKAFDERTLPAVNSFNKLIKEVPLFINRAPTLMKTNTMAVYPVPVEGKTIGLNILHLPGFAADFDGDAMSVYLPMTPEAIQEAKDKALPMHHLSDARKGFGTPMFKPGHEAVLGAVHLTEIDHEQKVVEFDSEDAALKALEEGKIFENTPIKIKGTK